MKPSRNETVRKNGLNLTKIERAMKSKTVMRMKKRKTGGEMRWRDSRFLSSPVTTLPNERLSLIHSLMHV